MLHHLGAFLVRLGVSTVVLMLSVGWVTPGNPNNTIERALAVSAFLAIASYLTLAKFLWFLLLPWLLYVVVWIVTITASYGLGFFTALLLSIALSIVSFLVSLLFGLRGL
jgi:putative membrane protein